MLVVGDRNRRDVARDLWRDGELARCDERVVGRLEMRRIVPVDVSRSPGQHEKKQPKSGAKGMPAEPTLGGFLAPLIGLAGLRLGRRRGTFRLGGGPLPGLGDGSVLRLGGGLVAALQRAPSGGRIAFGSKPPLVAFAVMRAQLRALGLQRSLSQLAIDVL